MDVGCIVPFNDATELASFVPRAAKAVEDRGFESLWLGEHTHLPVDTVYPNSDGTLPVRYRRFPDPWAILAASAVVTSRIRLGTLIALAAEHNPLILAKVIATVDQLSKGRVEVGVGYGWNRLEMENNGVDPRARRSVLREKVSSMRELWSGEAVGYEGEHVNFSPSWSLPAPTQRPGPKIHFGCGASQRNLVDVVSIADGFFPHRSLLSNDYTADLNRLRDTAAAAGRDPDSIDVSLGHIETSWGRADIEKFTRRLPSVAELESYQENGIRRVIVSIPAGPDDLFERALDAWAERVAAAGIAVLG